MAAAAAKVIMMDSMGLGGLLPHARLYVQKFLQRRLNTENTLELGLHGSA